MSEPILLDTLCTLYPLCSVNAANLKRKLLGTPLIKLIIKMVRKTSLKRDLSIDV
jgi:hypothetical protein